MTDSAMPPPFHHFDMHALSAALDAERQARGIPWTEMTAQINVPFQGTTSLPISLTTLRNMTKRRAVTGAVVLQVLAWLGRTPESFLTGRTDPPAAGERLPEVGPQRVLRFDTRILYAALDAQRIARGLTWKQAAKEMGSSSAASLTRMAKGTLTGFPHVMTLTQWLGQPAAAFVRVRSR